MTDLTKIVEALIATGKEGDHWDFKREHHERTGDLIKDIICLANSPRHCGDRYIIFGVTNDSSVVGLWPDAHRRTQADIVNTLASAGFAGGVYPDIHLERVELQGSELEVLVVKDHAEKPYYLRRKYDKSGVRLNPGTIYSRVRDSNTPSDQVASSHDIEKMWRERFGIDQTPFQRVRSYLQDQAAWTKTSEYTWHHSQFPEFTVSRTQEDLRPVRGGENWVRAALNPAAFVLPFSIRFHQTVLREVDCILYDEMRAITPAPGAKTVSTSDGQLWFHSLCANTLEFDLLSFFTRKRRGELLKVGLLPGGRLPVVPVILFRSESEKEAFVQENEIGPVTHEDYSRFVIPQFGSEVSGTDVRLVTFAIAAANRFLEWRQEPDN